VESIVNEISGHYQFMEPSPAKEEDIAAVHSSSHIGHVKGLGLYRISALAAGGAIQAAVLGLKEPCFADQTARSSRISRYVLGFLLFQ
jgi:hypothetical protein